MRFILALCVSVLIIGGVWGGFFAWRSAQPPSHFGEMTGAHKVPVTDLLSRPKDFLGKTVAVEGTVTEQCQTMGCNFFFVAPNGKLRVELKDIAMNAPVHEGRPARVEGQLVTYSDGYQLYATGVEFL